jgi:hypothetical protein
MRGIIPSLPKSLWPGKRLSTHQCLTIQHPSTVTKGNYCNVIRALGTESRSLEYQEDRPSDITVLEVWDVLSGASFLLNNSIQAKHAVKTSET